MATLRSPQSSSLARKTQKTAVNSRSLDSRGNGVPPETIWPMEIALNTWAVFRGERCWRRRTAPAWLSARYSQCTSGPAASTHIHKRLSARNHTTGSAQRCGCGKSDQTASRSAVRELQLHSARTESAAEARIEVIQAPGARGILRSTQTSRRPTQVSTRSHEKQ